MRNHQCHARQTDCLLNLFYLELEVNASETSRPNAIVTETAFLSFNPSSPADTFGYLPKLNRGVNFPNWDS